jgi:hypothetical protein
MNMPGGICLRCPRASCRGVCHCHAVPSEVTPIGVRIQSGKCPLGLFADGAFAKFLSSEASGRCARCGNVSHHTSMCNVIDDHEAERLRASNGGCCGSPTKR